MTDYYIIADSKFRFPDNKLTVRFPQQLDALIMGADLYDDHDLKYIFFPFWSHIIPKSIWSKYDCIVFHCTALPYGRGGTPIQNLIQRGHTDTVISAIKVNGVLDGGDIYLQKPLSLGGTCEEILIRATKIIEGMIEEIIKTNPKPKKQRGKVVRFERRKPEDSMILLRHDYFSWLSLSNLHDHIRMLDADGYPPAFIDYGNLRLTFTRSSLRRDRIICDCEIRVK